MRAAFGSLLNTLIEVCPDDAFLSTVHDFLDNVPDKYLKFSGKSQAAQEQDTAFYTPPKLAKRWGCDDGKVHRYIRSGELRAINLATEPSGRPRWRIALSDILAFERNRMNAPPPTPSPRKRPPKDDDTIKFY
jgi:hypothetical protein